MKIISPVKLLGGVYDVTKSLALGAKVPPVSEEVQTPEVVPPETVPLSKISEFKQIALGAEVVTRTPGEISIIPVISLSPHSFVKVKE